MAGKMTTAEERKAGLARTDDDAEVTQVLNAVDTTQPLDQRGNGGPPAVRDLNTLAADAITRDLRTLAGMAEWRHAETTSHARKVSDWDALAALAALAAEAFGDLRDLGHVGDELRRRVADQARAWAEGGGSA